MLGKNKREAIELVSEDLVKLGSILRYTDSMGKPYVNSIVWTFLCKLVSRESLRSVLKQPSFFSTFTSSHTLRSFAGKRRFYNNSFSLAPAEPLPDDLPYVPPSFRHPFNVAPPEKPRSFYLALTNALLHEPEVTTALTHFHQHYIACDDLADVVFVELLHPVLKHHPEMLKTSVNMRLLVMLVTFLYLWGGRAPSELKGRLPSPVCKWPFSSVLLDCNFYRHIVSFMLISDGNDFSALLEYPQFADFVCNLRDQATNIAHCWLRCLELTAPIWDDSLQPVSQPESLLALRARQYHLICQTIVYDEALSSAILASSVLVPLGKLGYHALDCLGLPELYTSSFQTAQNRGDFLLPWSCVWNERVIEQFRCLVQHPRVRSFIHSSTGLTRIVTDRRWLEIFTSTDVRHGQRLFQLVFEPQGAMLEFLRDLYPLIPWLASSEYVSRALEEATSFKCSASSLNPYMFSAVGVLYLCRNHHRYYDELSRAVHRCLEPRALAAIRQTIQLLLDGGVLSGSRPFILDFPLLRYRA